MDDQLLINHSHLDDAKNILLTFIESFSPTVRSIDSPYDTTTLEVFKLESSVPISSDTDKFKCKVLNCNKRYTKASMRGHVAKHILNLADGPSVQSCGFCGLSGNCSISLIENVKNAIPHSNCDYYYKFSIKPVAKEFSISGKCTNRPEVCKLCEQVFWTYNFESHFKKSHKGHECPYIVSDQEKAHFTN